MAALGMGIAIILFLLGMVGTILPVLPGAPLIWLGMLAYGLLTGFAKLGVLFFAGQAAAVAITFLIDYAGTAYGAKRFGGSSAAAWGSAAGIVVAPLVLGPVGFIVGPFAGAFVAELIRGRPAEASLRAAFGTLAGLVGATLLKLAVQAAMIAWFFWAVLR
ncbi:MAG: DUF456 domain-containing protein [Firmicutes bacterium]|nr:DUF456 domain-containing protein [Bacillota bacterium]